MQEFENNQIENDYITYTYTKKKKISAFLITVMMLSIIFSFPHIHAQAAISTVSSSTCPHNGNPGTEVGEVGCSYCGGTGGNWTRVAGHKSQGDSLSAGTGYQQKKWNEDNEYIYYERYRCENCGDDGSYDCKPYTDKIGLFKVNKNTGVETQLQSDPYSAGPGWVPIRQCTLCCLELHPSTTCYSIAQWAVPHVAKHTITVIANPSEGGITSGSGTYKSGTTITISATAKNGYTFNGWSDGNYPASRTVEVTSDKTYTANFASPTPTPTNTPTPILSSTQVIVSTSCVPAEGGSLSGEGIYEKGTSVTAVATPNQGWKLIKIEYYNSETGNMMSYTNLSSMTKTIDGNRSFVAYFENVSAPEPPDTPEITDTPEPTMAPQETLTPTPTPRPEVIDVNESTSNWNATIILDPNGGTYISDNSEGNPSTPPYKQIRTSSWETTRTTTWSDGRVDTSYNSGTSSGHNASSAKAYREPYTFAGYGLNTDWRSCISTGMVFDAEGKPVNSKYFRSNGYSKFGLSGTYTIYAIWLPPLYELNYLAPEAEGSMEPSIIEYAIASNLSKNLFEKPYSVRYDLNTTDTKAILYSDKGAIVQAPFLGWSRTENGAVEFQDEELVLHTIFPEDVDSMNLYAQFGEALVSLPVAERYGYHFMGWKAENQGESIPSGETATTTKDVTYYAQWKPKEYTVTFNPNGGTCSVSKKTVYFDSPYGELPAAERVGYNFVGWTYSSNILITEDSELMEYSDHELVAQWTPKQYSLYVDPNGGTVNGRDSLHEYGKLTFFSHDLYSIAIPQRIGYNFVDYSTRPDNLGVTVYDHQGQAVVSNYFNDEARYVNPASLTVYARWEAKTYKIRFDANGGECAIKDRVVQHGGNYGTLPIPTKKGSQFVGWMYETVLIQDDDPLAAYEDHVLVAQWEKIPYTVTFVWNWEFKLPGVDTDTSLPPYVNTKMVKFGEAYGELPTPSREGYTFLGWRLEQGENGNGTGEAILPSRHVDMDYDHSLYAQWEQNEYYLTFDYNDDHLY